MVSPTKNQDDMVNIDQELGSGSTKLDIDLSKTIKNGSEETLIPDIQVGCYEPSDTNEEITFSKSKELVMRPVSDMTIRDTRRKLERMHENHLLDVHDFQEKRIVHPEMEKFEILNAFREIRTKIIQKADGENKVIMVVSLQHGMGTTFNSVNLAAAFSYEGEKTSLLIDCDQSKRKLENFFPQEITYGLTDYLSDTSLGTEKIIYQTGIHRMRFIPIGSKGKAVGEFFSSERMKNFIVQIKKRYRDRYIILNTPPVETTADAAILSEVVDFVVFVLPYGKVSNQRLERGLKLLPKDKIIGFVINNKPRYV